MTMFSIMIVTLSIMIVTLSGRILTLLSGKVATLMF